MWYRVSTDEAMGLFLVLFWCAAVARAVLRYDSRFGGFNSRLSADKFPFSRPRELAGKSLIYLADSGSDTALIENNRENSRFHGNNREFRPPAKRAVAQPAVAAIGAAGTRSSCQPRGCSPLRATGCPRTPNRAGGALP